MKILDSKPEILIRSDFTFINDVMKEEIIRVEPIRILVEVWDNGKFIKTVSLKDLIKSYVENKT